MQAANAKDVPAVLSAVDPEEVHGLRDLWEAVSARADRLGLVRRGSEFDGVSIATTDLRVAVVEENEHSARLGIEDGEVRVSFDPADRSDIVGTGLAGRPGSVSLSAFRDFSSRPEVIAVKRDGRWYVSASMTLAGGIAQAEGAGWIDIATPEVSLGEADAEHGPVAAQTPEAAAERMLQAVASRYTGSVMDAVTPAHRRAVAAYPGHLAGESFSPMYDGVSTAVESASFTGEDIGDGRRVMRLQQASGTYYYDGGSTRFRIDPKCVEVSGADRACRDDEPDDPYGGLRWDSVVASQLWADLWSCAVVCASPMSVLVGGVHGFTGGLDDPDNVPAEVTQLMRTDYNPLAWVVAPVDGGWAVDPVHTVAFLLRERLEMHDDDELRSLLVKGAAR